MVAAAPRIRLAERTWLLIEAGALLLTATSLVLVVSAAVAWFTGGYDGLAWTTPDYQVLDVEPGSPGAQAGLRPGDFILALDGRPALARFPLYVGGPGTAVDITYRRGGQDATTVLTLARPPVAFLALRLTSLVIALLFSILSLAFSVGGRYSIPSLSFLLFYQLLAVVIASGSVVGLQLAWSVRVFYVALCLLMPAAIYMVSWFPAPRNERWLVNTRRIVTLVAIGGAVALLSVEPWQLFAGPAAWVTRLVLLSLLVTVLLSLVVVTQSFRRALDAEAKAAVRVSALGLSIAVLPFVSLYLVPRVIIGRGLVSGELALLSLAALPLYHGLGLTRRRFSALEKVLPPVSAAVISAVVFILVLMGLMWLAKAIWPAGGDASLYAGVVVGAGILAAANVRVITGARRMVHRAFFGQVYDYQSIVSDMSRDLAQAAGRQELGRLVVEALRQRMSLVGAGLLTLHEGSGRFELEGSSEALAPALTGISLDPDGPLVAVLRNEPRPLSREVLRQRLAQVTLPADEARLLADDRLALWAAIEVYNRLRGFVVLGNKQRDALFSHDDLAIVGTLAGQIGVGMENADLYDSLRAEMRKLQEMQNQLVQAEKLSAVGELVSGVAHELNNPLTAVIGYAELLRAETTDENSRKDIENILRSAERSMRIVRNLLTFARRQKSERRMVDMNEIISQTLEIQAYQLRVDNIGVETDLDLALPHTAADGAQLQQVMLNILMNAHQAMRGAPGRETARGTIHVQTRGIAGNAIHIVITDDGPGVPPEVLGRIFDPFFTTKEVGVGTGLGLSICYGIVHGHGGRIWCESELGKGAAFHIELPVRRMRAEQDSTDPVPPPTRPGTRVLVVEDEVAVAAVLQRLLVKRSFQVSLAHSGVEALALIASKEFDVVISDIRMPDMGGIALWESLKASHPRLATRVIFVTGDTANIDTSAFLKGAGQPVLPKPFGMDDLVRAIGQLQEQVAEPERHL